MSSTLLMIGVASTLNSTTSIQVSSKDPVYRFWNKVKDYMGDDTLQETYQNVYIEYLK